MGPLERRSKWSRTALGLSIAFLSATALVHCSLLTSASDYSRGSTSSSSTGAGDGGPNGDAFVNQGAISFPRVFLLGGRIATNPTDMERAPFAVWSAGFDPDGRLVDWRQHPYATANSDAWSIRVVGSNLALVGVAGDAGVFFMHAPLGPEGLGAFRDHKIYPVFMAFEPDPKLSLSLPFVWADDDLVTLGGTYASGRPTLAKHINVKELLGPQLTPSRFRDAGPGPALVHESPTLLAHDGSIYVIGFGPPHLEVLRFDSDAGVSDVQSVALGTAGAAGACLVGSEKNIYVVGGLDDGRTVKTIAVGSAAATDGPKLVAPRYWPSCFIRGSRLYAAGGSHLSGLTAKEPASPEVGIESMRVSPDGTPDGPWEAMGSLPVPMMRGAAIVVEAPPPASDE